ncbi:cobalamin biosynthesis protein [Rhizobium sp. S152]|uniref:cobalamin biosynthesis protein n=1 Tax=Rhizobium sp. S152 TaxID=3055038 RepID=UPI0025A95C91|nr:cobalamin biosynthesis protein [Rhizobium sp. S152]MDM9628400.1 cobalamin biosynthesis protein [Rhizobium sp. S152]
MTSLHLDRNRRYVLGLGCERGTPPAEVLELAETALRTAGAQASRLAGVASIDSRRDEPAILAVAAHFGVPAVFFDAGTLERETPRIKNPSDIVFARVGCHGVAEPASLAAIGLEADLVVPKIKSAHATAAVACIRLRKE